MWDKLAIDVGYFYEKERVIFCHGLDVWNVKF